MGDGPLCECIRCARERGDGLRWGELFLPYELTRMCVCDICGNKRCPHSDDHRNPCTGSNEPGQPGSRYTVERMSPTARHEPLRAAKE